MDDKNGGSIFASYATGNADGGDRANYAGTVTGLQNGTIAASYGFGTPTNGTLGGVSIRPAGVTAATALTAANTAQCSNRTYTTSKPPVQAQFARYYRGRLGRNRNGMFGTNVQSNSRGRLHHLHHHGNMYRTWYQNHRRHMGTTWSILQQTTP